MAFDGISGTGACCFGLLAEGESLLLFGVEGLGESLRSGANRVGPSNFVGASGGGKGEIDRAEMDAECAW